MDSETEAHDCRLSQLTSKFKLIPSGEYWVGTLAKTAENSSQAQRIPQMPVRMRKAIFALKLS